MEFGTIGPDFFAGTAGADQYFALGGNDGVAGFGGGDELLAANFRFSNSPGSEAFFG